jgi:hypothetical protein
MSYEEIRLMFLQYYEKRLKLQLLRSELETIKQTSYSLVVPERELFTRNPIGEFRLAVLETVLADTYTILAQQVPLLTLLTSTRTLCGQVNQEIQRWTPVACVYMDVVGKEHLLKRHNEYINRQGTQIRTCCDSAIQMLDEFLSKA